MFTNTDHILTCFYICADVDECARNEDSCSIFAQCFNTVGTYACSCIPGYAGDGRTCTGIISSVSTVKKVKGLSIADVDECARGTDDCAPNAECGNTQGSFQCVCREGFEGNGRTCRGLWISFSITKYVAAL